MNEAALGALESKRILSMMCDLAYGADPFHPNFPKCSNVRNVREGWRQHWSFVWLVRVVRCRSLLGFVVVFFGVPDIFLDLFTLAKSNAHRLHTSLWAPATRGKLRKARRATKGLTKARQPCNTQQQLVSVETPHTAKSDKQQQLYS